MSNNIGGTVGYLPPKEPTYEPPPEPTEPISGPTPAKQNFDGLILLILTSIGYFIGDIVEEKIEEYLED